MPPPDYYAALQVDPAADPEVVEAAYRRRARKLHPDRNPDPDAHRSMQALNEAYGVLSDPARRAAYDGSRAAAPPPPAPGGDGAGGGPAAPVRFAPDLPAAAVVGLYAVALPVALGLLLYAAGLPGPARSAGRHRPRRSWPSTAGSSARS